MNKIENTQPIALDIAVEYVKRFTSFVAPHCHILDIAGSVRRKKKVIDNIDIVLIPKRDIVTNLLGEVHGEYNSPLFIAAVNSMALQIIKGKIGDVSTRYVQIESNEGIIVNIYMPKASDYYRQLAIRTGTAEWVKRKIAAQWVLMGWVGTEHGLRKREHCMIQLKKWVVINSFATKPPAWETEEDFFRWLKVPFISPEYRF